MRNFRLVCTVALAACSSVAFAQQQSFSNLACRAGTVSNLAKGEDMVAFAIDQRGILLAEDAAKAFHNFTQRCVGSVAIVRGKASGGGFCRLVDPSNGDMYVIEWTASEKPGIGTFKFLSGTGKWKGISGSGEYQPVAQTRPVDEGTYQNCVRNTGTFSVPKM